MKHQNTKVPPFERFYLLNPRGGTDVTTTARKLMSFEEVKEVYVTDGSHGFVVKARFCNGRPPKLVSYLQKKMGRDFSEATAHFAYKK